MRYLQFIGLHWRDVLSAAFLGGLIGVMALIISWRQLHYAKKRDAALDARNQWEKVHKAMLEFRFRREVLNMPLDHGLSGSEAALEASHALHMLRGELDRAPDSPLVTKIHEHLMANFPAEQWRAPQFVEKFDEYAHEVAKKTQE
jgi:hypothetical protein